MRTVNLPPPPLEQRGFCLFLFFLATLHHDPPPDVPGLTGAAPPGPPAPGRAPPQHPGAARGRGGAAATPPPLGEEDGRRDGWRQAGPALPAPSRAAVVLKPGGPPAPSPKGSCTPPGARAGGNKGKKQEIFRSENGEQLGEATQRGWGCSSPGWHLFPLVGTGYF